MRGKWGGKVGRRGGGEGRKLRGRCGDGVVVGFAREMGREGWEKRGRGGEEAEGEVWKWLEGWLGTPGRLCGSVSGLIPGGKS